MTHPLQHFYPKPLKPSVSYQFCENRKFSFFLSLPHLIQDWRESSSRYLWSKFHFSPSSSLLEHNLSCRMNLLHWGECKTRNFPFSLPPIWKGNLPLLQEKRESDSVPPLRIFCEVTTWLWLVEFIMYRVSLILTNDVSNKWFFLEGLLICRKDLNTNVV